MLNTAPRDDRIFCHALDALRDPVYIVLHDSLQIARSGHLQCQLMHIASMQAQSLNAGTDSPVDDIQVESRAVRF